MRDRHYDKRIRIRIALMLCYGLVLRCSFPVGCSRLWANRFLGNLPKELIQIPAWMPPAQLHLLNFPLCFKVLISSRTEWLQIIPLTDHFVTHFPSIMLDVPPKFCPWFNACQQDNTDSKFYYQFKLKVTEAGFAGPGIRNFAIQLLNITLILTSKHSFY